MKYVQPYNEPNDPNAGYVNGNPETGEEGSIPPAEAIEYPQREIHNFIEFAHALRPGDVGEPTNGDLEQLRKSVQALINAAIGSLSIGGEFVLKADLAANAQNWPDVLTGGGVLSITPATGSVSVNTGGEWIWRNHRRFTTTDRTDLAHPTVANKTYHLRWYAPGHAMAPANTYPNGRIMLRDLADTASYNPGAVPENSTTLDSKFDDMLIARVVTSPSNVPTVTALRNSDRNTGRTVQSGVVTNPDQQDSATTINVTINAGRAPTVVPWVERASGPTQTNVDNDETLSVSNVTRYGFTLNASHDFANQITLGAAWF